MIYVTCKLINLICDRMLLLGTGTLFRLRAFMHAWMRANLQIEYYFSFDNMCRDVFLRSKMDEEGCSACANGYR